MEEQNKSEDRIDPTQLFSEGIRESVTGLTWLGYLNKTVHFCGHTVTLETIRPSLKIAIGQAMEPYRNTLAQPHAWEAMNVGVSLTSVDGKVDFCPPMTDNAIDFARARMSWIVRKTEELGSGWLTPTISYFYAEWAALENTAAVAVGELQDLSVGGRVTSLHSPASSTEPESSGVKIDLDLLADPSS